MERARAVEPVRQSADTERFLEKHSKTRYRVVVFSIPSIWQKPTSIFELNTILIGISLWLRVWEEELIGRYKTLMVA
jgi:hypothetical protein